MKKVLIKLLSIGLVAVLFVTSLGAYSGENSSANADKEFAIYQSDDGVFKNGQEMSIFKRIFSSNKVLIKNTQDYKDIYIGQNEKLYHEIQDNIFVPVEKLSYNLNSSDAIDGLSSTDLPKEILEDIEETASWIKDKNASPDANVVLFARPSGQISTTYAIKNGIEMRIYEVRFINMSSNWEEIAKGTSVSAALLTTVKEVASYSPYYLPISIFESFVTAADAWRSVFGVSTINVHSENKLTMKLDYDMKIKYGFVELEGLNYLKHSATFSAIELDEIHSYLTYRDSTFEFGKEMLTRYVNEEYKSESYDNPTDWTYQYRDVNAGIYFEDVEDMYVEYKKGLFNTKTRFRIIPPSFDMPDDWHYMQ